MDEGEAARIVRLDALRRAAARRPGEPRPTPPQIMPPTPQNAASGGPAVSSGLPTAPPGAVVDALVRLVPTMLPVVAARIGPNGYQGASAAVLQPASVRGVAASMYWNVDALTRLSFARSGELHAAFELGREPLPTRDDLQPVLADLDFASYGDQVERGLVAVERFTGYAVGPADLERIEVGPAYVIRG